MFGLFKSRRSRHAERTARGFDTFVAALKGMDGSEIAFVLDMAARIKDSSLLLSQSDPNAIAIYRKPIDVAENIAIAQLEIFESQMRSWMTEGLEGRAKVGALSIWYLSLAAGTFAEQRYLGREMWAQLSRGFPYVQRFNPGEDAVIGLEPNVQ